MSEPTQNPIPALQALEKHLQEQTEHGVERVHLSPEALNDLNSLQAAVSSATAPPPPPPPPPAPATPPPPTPAPAPVTTAPTPQPNPAPAATAPVLNDEESRLRLRDIAIRAKKCEATRALGSLRTDFVFANGNPRSDLMFIGDAPGMEEEKKHRPFVGPAGQLLDKIVKAMGFDRDDVYYSNIVKFRPSTNEANQGTRNRKPSPEEMATSIQFVLEEITVVQPKVIVLLGEPTMHGLLGLDGNLGGHRSKFHDLRGIPVMITHHPSHLLRSGEKSEKRKVWEDLMLVMERLGMEVSSKQRSFFL